jgi:hypothetical protein
MMTALMNREGAMNSRELKIVKTGLGTRSLVVMVMFASEALFSAEVEPMRDKACPDAWSMTDKAIPVVRSTANPWGEGTDDKVIAKAHLSEASPVITVDALPITNDDLVNDNLTVASECLVYRNMLVNGDNYYPLSPPTERNVATGFIPASVF